MADPQIPSVVAMLVCDQIINEEGTNKKSLIGVFQQINSQSYPMIVPRLSVYVKLVEVMRKCLFKLRIVRLVDEGLIAEVGIQAEIHDATLPTELALNIGNLVIPQAGKYEFQLYAEDIYLHRIVIDARQLQGGPQWQLPQKPHMQS